MHCLMQSLFQSHLQQHNQMGRRDQIYLSQTDFRGGINTEPENARPNQVLDARNVWAPEGQLIQRPGFTRVAVTITGTGVTTSGEEMIAWDTDGTTILVQDTSGAWSFGTLTAGQYWGFAASEKYNGRIAFSAGNTGNTNTAITGRLEYWNGTVWVRHPGGFMEKDSEQGYHIGPDSDYIFHIPSDWATGPDSDFTDKYVLRWKILGGTTSGS